MILIGNDIYCRESVFMGIEVLANGVTHVARRLIQGVYTPEAIIKGTLTGQQPRAQGAERQKEDVLCLDQKARKAIIGWSIQNS